MYKLQQIWQFLCDSAYDLLHLKDKYGQENLSGWWETRVYEWKHIIRR